MLTSNDNLVLTQLFDPESAPTAGIVIDPTLPEDPIVRDAVLLNQIRHAEKTIIQAVESVMQKPFREAHQGLEKARTDLESLLEIYPESASLLNDFAQVVRLQHGDQIFISQNISPRITSKVLASLDKAISLLTPPTPQSSMSPAQSRTLAQAHTQRGALFHGASKALTSNSGLKITVPSLQMCTAVDLAEAASKDFFLGGRYGNEVAKGLAVHTNPTAKLCGQMVQDAMRRELAAQY